MLPRATWLTSMRRVPRPFLPGLENKKGQFLINSVNFLAGIDKNFWPYMVVIEDIMRESAWETTDSILPYIAI